MSIDDLVLKSKQDLTKVLETNYDIFWKTSIQESTKAISYNKFKTRIAIEPHLAGNMNPKFKIALSRFRLSNHSLMIEKGRHLNIDRNLRKLLLL